MTTTSAADLLAHASLLTRQLRDIDAPITGAQWATFDVTVHRLMLELIGGGALHTQGQSRTPPPPALAVFRSYPEPLRYPVDTQLSAQEAAALASRRPEYFRRKIQHGNLHAVRDGGAYLINTRDLDQNPDIAPADLSDPHPLARVSCVLGAMADLVVAEREADPGRLMDD
ncbi:helix-turn-helix domain-containing protein, partial [Salmonella enterica subsp. enterica serovar Senftenberg]|nr:helix-turn-helix domain-containing protein [Salmonella enterica subsp. enterica serovar Senftenberg]